MGGVASADNGLIISGLDRTIDLTTQLVKIHHKISLENSGKSPVKSMIFAVEKGLKDHVAFRGATAGTSGDKKTYLRVSDTKDGYQIELREPLAPGKTTKLDVEL